MKLILFTFLVSLFMAPISAYGQFKAPQLLMRERKLPTVETSISQPKNETEIGNELNLVGRIIAALKRLESDVVVYRSLGGFEADGRLARVPFEVFKDDLQEVTAEVEPILSRLPQSRFKRELTNALASYRDGEFWWRKIHQPRTVNIYAMSFAETTRAPSDAFFASNLPYTVAIHWRQGAKYLRSAQELLNEKNNAR